MSSTDARDSQPMTARGSEPREESVEQVARVLFDAYEDHHPAWTWERCEAEDEMGLTLDAYRHQAKHVLLALPSLGYRLDADA